MAKYQQSDKVFVKKLNAILDENYSSEDFGVKELAAEIGLSHTQLHRKIKAEFKKSTSQFIREFRLEKALALLHENVTSVAEVSYNVGFNSPTYFNKCFNAYFGYPPGEAKYNINKTEVGKKESWRNLPKLALVGVFLLLAVLMIVLSTVILRDKQPESASVDSPDESSIAVLPFKILSDDESNRYFADGVMDDIINHLSAINDLRVISRTTMDQYRETTKTIPEIAEELKVSYVIESSIQKYRDSVKLIIQLIDAGNDRHIWSQDFKREFSNIFSLETEIAKHIAHELKATLSPGELDKIGRVPTGNMDAYNLYIQGKYSFDSNDNNDLVQYKEVLERCLELDPDFSLAYAALARIKIQRMRSRYLQPTKKEIEKAKELALKSIEIDDNARGHASLGWLYLWFEWNWEEAEKQFRLAIQANPNYAGGYIYLSQLLYNIKGDFTEARKQLDLALYLAPLEYYPRAVSAYFYFNNGDFNKSIEETQKMKQINANNPDTYWYNFLNFAALGKEKQALDELMQGGEELADTAGYVQAIQETFNRSGINGVYQWLGDNGYRKGKISVRPYNTARYYTMAGDIEKAIKWLEICYDQRDPQLPFIKYESLFQNLRSDPKFLSILRKMKLGNY